MKRSFFLGRSLAVAPLVLTLALGSTGLASAATASHGLPRPAVSHAHPAAKQVVKKTVKHKLVHRKVRKVVVKKAVHKTTTAGGATGTSAAPTPVALTGFEARLVTLVNQARVANGESPLTVVAGATDVARRWSVKLAGDDALSHNPDISQDLQAAGSPDWTFIAENVGETDAGDADGLFAAYMASPHHRENILDPRAIEIGMGAVTTPEPEGDTTFNTMDFVNSYNPAYGVERTNPITAELPLAGLVAAL